MPREIDTIDMTDRSGDLKKVLNRMIEDEKLFVVITWPEIQTLMTIEEFDDNSYLINDEDGVSCYGSSSYFVSVSWLIEKELI